MTNRTFSVKLYVTSNGEEIYVVANGSVAPAERDVGIMSASLEDVTFCDVETGEDREIVVDNWDEVYDSIWSELNTRHR
jgi:hypothetical protein